MSKCLLRGISTMVLLSGCLAETHDSAVHESPETVTNAKGGTYLRADLWEPSDRARMRRLAAASVLPGASLEEIAEGTRGVMQHHSGRIYIQEVPDYDLARMIYAGEAEAEVETLSTPASTGVAGRNIIGTDDRLNNSSSANGWQQATMFSEIGCSGARVGEHTAVTAAHCVFDTLTASGGGWRCRDGMSTPDVFTFCSQYPRWRFGVDGTAGNSNWVAVDAWDPWPLPLCATVVVPLSFDGVTALGWTYARHDYAVVDFSDCPASTWPNGTFSFGTVVLNDAELAALTANAVGYPYLFKCPAGQPGISNILFGGDCPMVAGGTTGVIQYTGSPVPFSGAELYVSTSADITKGESESAYTIKSLADTTQGQSGGPLLRSTLAAGHQIVGIASQGTSTRNLYRRWTSSLHTWVAANSLFPDD